MCLNVPRRDADGAWPRRAHASVVNVSVIDPPAPPPDDDGVDVSLIRWMLSLSADDRLAVLQGFADSVAAMTDDAPRA